AVATATGGASAALGASAVMIANGQAAVMATANATPGRYTATATVPGVGAVDFVLTNARLVVTTAQDDTNDTDSFTSLREAIAYANVLSGPGIITFDPTVFGTTAQTITLTDGPLSFTDTATTTITGPGENLLTVSGKHASQVFQ